MIPNPFLNPVQGNSIGPPAGPVPDQQAFNQSMMAKARADAMRYQLKAQGIANQQGNVNQGASMLAPTISKFTASAVGGAGAAAASMLPPEAAGAASPSVAPAAGASLGSMFGQGLGVAAVGYGAYSANRNAEQDVAGLNAAINSGSLSPDQERAARQSSFNAGMVSEGIGGAGGVLGGSSFGPIGAVVGGLLGASGGARQAWESEPDNQSRFQALAQFQKDPFKK